MRQFAAPKDLTVGRPLPLLAAYSIPMLVSMFFQQAYNLVDSWIAGNWIGSVALGAVGTCYPVTVFFLAIASGLSMGTSIYCSQSYGAREYGGVQAGIVTSLRSFLPFSAVLCALGLAGCGMILRLLAVPEEALAATEQYLRVYLLGMPFLFLYNLSNGVLNGLGDSVLPLLFLILSCLCNIVLDLCFVTVIPIGVAGLALATLLSQAAASLAAAAAVHRMYRRLGEDSRAQGAKQGRFSGAVLGAILRLGIPSAIQHAFMSTGQLFLQNVINGYGVVVMAGYSVAFRINGIVINSLMAVSNALSGYIAQNRGAGLYRRVRRGYAVTLALSLVFSALVIQVLLPFGSSILDCFVQESAQKAEIIQAGTGFLQVVVPFYLLVTLKIVSDGALRGIGAMNLFMLATVSDVLVRIFCGGLFSRQWGIYGVWSIWPTAWLVGTLISFCAYRYFSRRFPEDAKGSTD